MNVPADLLYSTDHEWVRDLGGGRIRIGITDYAQDALGDVVFVEVPVVLPGPDRWVSREPPLSGLRSAGAG